ncbi:nucleolar protein 6 isoform X1 [Fukomys damarensis]|uniref:Nucleolar protein 6 n=1 Tax=Fukomys damarensis TaxID=885580 RepID=A0A091DXZ1_FUKDA|nr:nucleolar protein 6 isoform X1 [Fukomys damarensis]KFO35328.1 Nucleolar protein 6 [Fukomys damarensis]
MGPAPAGEHLRRTAGMPEVMEPALEGTVQEGKKISKRKYAVAETPAESLLQPVKLSREELYKEPTNEELNRLRETEILFHSSLLRLQVEELLKEIRLSEKKKCRIDVFLREVNQRIKKVPLIPETELIDQSWLPAGVRVPLHQVPYAVKGSFCFLPPAQVTVVGSYLLGTCTRPNINVDMALTMPREILQDKDLLNQRYFRKRALYLAHLAHHLAQDPLFGSVCFSYTNGCHLKPSLLLRPHGKDEHLVTVRLHPCPPSDFFRPCRLLPTKNNVRSAWYQGQSHPGDGKSEPPTPHYNTWVLQDTALESHMQLLSTVLSSAQGLKDGVTLLKVWLRQRELDKGLGGFNGFLISMLVAFLVSTRKIHTTMSGYQVLRSTLQFLATTDLTVNGISLCLSSAPSLPALADFHQAFPVVFLDPSGRLNLCADVTASTYHQVQHEARLSMVLLDSRADDAFQLLLMTPKSMVRSFDHIVHLRPLSRLQAACHQLKLCPELQDSGGDYVSAVLGPLTTLLKQGLGTRLQLLAHSRPSVPEWNISQDPPKHKDCGALTLGLLLQPEGLTSVLELGPEADQPEAADFRQFWGSRSELRRFQDGAIREAVVWEAASLYQKRLIPHQVVTHLLALHADIPDSCVHYVGGFLDALIQGPKETSSTGEEALTVAVRCYDDLSRLLWGLEGLPLTVSAVQGAHPALRYTEVFPPTPVRPAYSFHEHLRERALLLPRPNKPCPAYVEPMTVVCHLEGSGQWPQDAEAVQRVRAAFQLRLAELLAQQHGLQCRATATHTDVLKDGFVFRIRVAYQREPQILKEVQSPEGMISLRDTPASLRLERDTKQLPLLTSALHGLQQQHPAFSVVARLAKRWVRSQLLGEGLTDECLDLVTAALFLHPEPFTPPSSPQVGFLRFLSLISTFDWKNNPLIINLNNELTAEEQVEIHSGFLEARTRLPVMVLITPQDRKGSVWTQNGPSAQILQRLVILAAEALLILEKQLMDPQGPGDIRTVFRPHLDIYDVLIRLSPRHIPRHRQGVDCPAASFCRGLLREQGPSSLMPVLGYDPPQLYLAQLREAFGDLALFFYDQHGGEVIGVLWKPTSFQPQPFKASSTKGRMVVSQGEELVMVPNVEAILEDFAVLGEGLVQAVEARSERWSV